MVTATEARWGSSRSLPISTIATSVLATAAAGASPRCIRSSRARPISASTDSIRATTRRARPSPKPSTRLWTFHRSSPKRSSRPSQAALKARSPQWMPPRAVSGPTLLTGICFCASCGGAMTLRTGKGSAGGMYRYYTCSTKARQGERGCRGLTVPMDKLDRAGRRSLGVAAARSGAFDDDDGSVA